MNRRADVAEGYEGSNVPSFGERKLEALDDTRGSRDCKDGRIGLGATGKSDLDKDFLCPICFQTIKDAFLTACGHSFCYMCIKTHLKMKSSCATCDVYLLPNQLYPNFLLNRLLRKASACNFMANGSPVDNIRLALTQGEVSLKDLDSLLALLTDKKHKAEQEEVETNMDMLLEFLYRSRQTKQQDLNELQEDLSLLKEDIAHVERERQELFQSKDQCSKKVRILFDGPSPQLDDLPCNNSSIRGAMALARGGQGGANVLIPSSQRKAERRQRSVSVSSFKDEATGDSGDCHVSESPAMATCTGVMAAKKRRVLTQFEDLQQCYLQKRKRNSAMMRMQAIQDAGVKSEVTSRERHAGLDDFHSVLTSITRYSKLRVIAELQHGDLFHSSNIVSSIEFDRDDEYFATAGVSRCIKVFEYGMVVNEMADVHCPEVEMTTRSKLSCLSWNKYIKSHIASSDYEGIVTVWDVNSRQSILEYEEHEKRAWSVDFSKKEPTRLVSGSDDGKVKVWCTRQESSVMNIDMNANICCVKFNPGPSNYVAVGSADSNIHYFDLRHIQQPLYVFQGHRKAVSYVKFVSPNELASASTDGTLRLWDVQDNCAIRTLKGHNNQKNFVGLSVNSEYMACGSETNEVYVYHKEMSRHTASHRFGASEREDSDDDSFHFISAVCWKSESPTMLAANSQALKERESAAG